MEIRKEKYISAPRKKNSASAFNRSKRADQMQEQRGNGQSSMPPLSPTDDNPLATYEPEEQQDPNTQNEPQSQTENNTGNNVQPQPTVTPRQQPSPQEEQSQEENNGQQQQRQTPIKQRGLATQMFNSFVRNKNQINTLRQTNANLRNNELKKKQAEMDKVREEMEPIESKIHRLQVQRTALIIWAIFLTIIAILCAITIFLIPIVTLPLLGIAGGMISPIVQRSIQIKLEEGKIKKPKEKEEQLVKEKDGIIKQIRQNDRQIQLLTNQSVLSRRRKTAEAT